jgi:hypothetical protein
MSLKPYAGESAPYLAKRIVGQAADRWDLVLNVDEVRTLIGRRLGYEEWSEVTKQGNLAMRDILAVQYQTGTELIGRVGPPLFTTEEARRKRGEIEVGRTIKLLLDYYGIPVDKRTGVLSWLQRHAFETLEDVQIVQLLGLALDAVARHHEPDDPYLLRLKWPDLVGEMPIRLTVGRKRQEVRDQALVRLLPM